MLTEHRADRMFATAKRFGTVRISAAIGDLAGAIKCNEIKVENARLKCEPTINRKVSDRNGEKKSETRPGVCHFSYNIGRTAGSS